MTPPGIPTLEITIVVRTEAYTTFDVADVCNGISTARLRRQVYVIRHKVLVEKLIQREAARQLIFRNTVSKDISQSESAYRQKNARTKPAPTLTDPETRRIHDDCGSDHHHHGARPAILQFSKG